MDENNNGLFPTNNDRGNKMGYIDSISEDMTTSRLQRALIVSEILNKPVAKREKSRRRYLRRKP
ncbi:hypothetical protein [Clostridium polynesiense]|uniref:hypothetical protein n=1 Tax=Clostridium polynesiense TaxID=1325933 RepID=UPI00058FA711|nr:hypothetical protein [Clostridium polynesiense]